MASGASNTSSKITGQPKEGVFDIRIPNILDPYMSRARSFGRGYRDTDWWGEVINFTAYGSDGQGTASAGYRVQMYSPLVLDFMSIGRPMFSSMDASNVRFDLDGDGRSERTGWLSGYRDMGFLALDLNGNGLIDNGLELFGEGTRIQTSGKKARDGYAALAQYDTNKDGMIDARDPIYNKLLVWFDKNQDGKTNTDELVPLAQAGVTKVGLRYVTLKDAGRFVNGNEMRTAAKFWGPQNCGDAGCQSYDVYFSTGFTLTRK